MKREGEGRGMEGNTMEHKERINAADLVAFTRLFMVNYILIYGDKRKIVNMKAPPHLSLPSALTGMKGRKTIQHRKSCMEIFWNEKRTITTAATIPAILT